MSLEAAIALLLQPANRSALAGSDRDAGLGLDAAVITATVRALCARSGELDAAALEHVQGGARAYSLPETDDQVLVAFLRGDIRAPVVLGMLWSGNDKPPTAK